MTTRNFPAEARISPGKIPPLHAVRQLFWDCLLEVDQTFSRRAEGWKYKVELWDNDYPMTSNDGRTNVTVWLTRKRSWLGYYFEAAHEAVHCLNPLPPGERARYLEEAVAVAFSLYIVERNFGPKSLKKCPVRPDYARAHDLATRIDENVINLGQRLRSRAVALEYVTANMIKEVYPDTDAAIIQAILCRFPRQ